MSRNIPVGISDFEKIRQDGYYYIDKSVLISELLKAGPVEVTLLTRPRRFGKTLGMSMLANFFDIRKDSKKLFEGLEIAGFSDLCENWMNQYPTLFFSFKDINGLDFWGAKEMLRNQIAQLCNEHSYRGTSKKVNENDRKVFLAISDTVHGEVSDAQLKTSISLVMRMMQAHYGKPVVFASG